MMFNALHLAIAPLIWPDDPTIPLKGLVYAIGGIVLALGAVWGFRKLQYIVAHRGPMRLFASIARDLGLRTPEIFLLYRISHQQKLPSPITLLASGSTLDHYAQQYFKTQPSRIRKVQRVQVAAIRQRLFDKPAAASTGPATSEG